MGAGRRAGAAGRGAGRDGRAVPAPHTNSSSLQVGRPPGDRLPSAAAGTGVLSGDLLAKEAAYK